MKFCPESVILIKARAITEVMRTHSDFLTPRPSVTELKLLLSHPLTFLQCSLCTYELTFTDRPVESTRHGCFTDEITFISKVVKPNLIDKIQYSFGR